MPWVFISKYRLKKAKVEEYLKDRFKNTPISLEVSPGASTSHHVK